VPSDRRREQRVRPRSRPHPPDAADTTRGPENRTRGGKAIYSSGEQFSSNCSCALRHPPNARPAL
jgi:hypothetical protein